MAAVITKPSGAVFVEIDGELQGHARLALGLPRKSAEIRLDVQELRDLAEALERAADEIQMGKAT